MLDEVIDVLRAGHYTRNVALALENQEYLREMVLEKVKEDRTVGRLSRLLVGDILRQNIDQIRSDVHAKGVAGAIRDVGKPEPGSTTVGV